MDAKNIKGVILDFDDVIVHTRKRLCDIYNNNYKDLEGFIEADSEKYYNWNMKDVCPLINSVQDLAGVNGVYENIGIIEGAIEGIKYLSEKTEVIICTSGGYKNQIEKAKFIEKYLPFVKGTIFATNISKKLVNMEGYIFVDDNAFNLDEANAGTKICLSHTKYECNAHWKGIWAKDWKELIEIIDRELGN